MSNSRLSNILKNTVKVKVNNETEYNEYSEMLISRGFKQIGTRLFEDSASYVRIIIDTK